MLTEDDLLVGLWCQGRNTKEIADRCGLDECDVAARIPHLMERIKARKAAARKALAGVEKRVGVAPVKARGLLIA
jgi:DNA-binding NarL/FixJ family response regulator